MARIENTTQYPLKANPTDADFLIGTDTANSNKTVSFSIGSIVTAADLFLEGYDESGTKLGGNLIVTIGDFSDLSTGQKIIVNIANQTNTFSGTNIFEGQINASTNKIINVADPTLDQDASTKKYTDDHITTRNFSSVKSVYFFGDASTEESWRGIVIDPPDKLSFQHFEPLTEVGIDLDEAHVTSIENNPIYTDTNPYFASVATDTRSNQSQPAGISGDMTGRFIEWDGFLWLNFPDQWVEKGSFSESFFSDRGIFQRMTVIETDPNDPTKYPPTPQEGTTIGSRNTLITGLGREVISFNDKFGAFGNLVEMHHGEDADLIFYKQIL